MASPRSSLAGAILACLALFACKDDAAAEPGPAEPIVESAPLRASINEPPPTELAASAPALATPRSSAPTARIGSSMLRHSGFVDILAAARDAPRFASANAKSIRVWSNEDGSLVTELRTKGTDALALDPDGEVAISVDDRGSAHVWQIAEAGELAQLDLYGDGEHVITAASFSADASRLVVGDQQGKLAVWDMTRRRPLAVFDGGHGYVAELALAPDGRRLVFASQPVDNDGDGVVAVYELDAIAELAEPVSELAPTRVFAPKLGIIVALALTPDAKRLAIGSQEQGTHMFELPSGRRGAAISKRREHVNALAFAPDGKSVALALSDERSAARYTLGGSKRRSYSGPADELLQLLFVGERLVGAGTDGTIHVWNAASGEPAFPQSEGGGPVLDLAASADLSTLATITPDRQIRLWDGESLALERTIEAPKGYVHAIALSPDAAALAVTLEGGVAIYDARSGSLTRTVADGERTFDVAFSPDGQRLASTTFDRLTIWSVEDGRALQQLARASSHERVTRVIFAPDGGSLAAAWSDGLIWRIEPERQPSTFELDRETHDFDDLAYDGRRVATWVDHGRGLVYDFETDERGAEFEPPIPLAFLPDGRLLATGYRGEYGNALVVVDAGTGEVVHTYRGHDAPISAVVVSVDGQRIASASRDTTVLLWAAPPPG